MLKLSDIRAFGEHGDDAHPSLCLSMVEPKVVEIQVEEPAGKSSAWVHVSSVALLNGLVALVENDIQMFNEDARFKVIHDKKCKECK